MHSHTGGCLALIRLALWPDGRSSRSGGSEMKKSNINFGYVYVYRPTFSLN